MQVENRFGQKGSAADKYNIKSPYPFQTSLEHYQAWLTKANGGTKHTLATLPDWDGLWTVRDTWLDSNDIQASTVAAALTPRYREYYVQQVKAEAEGRHWWAAAFCLPDGFIRGVSRGPQQFVLRPNQVVMVTDTLVVDAGALGPHRQGASPRRASSSRSGSANRSASGTGARW